MSVKKNKSNKCNIVTPSIPVCLCGKLLEDPNFSDIVPTLSEKWMSVLQCCTRVPECPCGKTLMDSTSFQDDKFQVLVDCAGFGPCELVCNVLIDKIELFGESTNCGRSIKMIRRYELPDSVDPKLATFHLTADGIAVISAPWLP